MDNAGICQVDGCLNPAYLDDIPLCRPHVDALLDPAMRTSLKIGLRFCSIDGCDGQLHSTYSSYCFKHYMRAKRRGVTADRPLPQPRQHSSGYVHVSAKGHPMAVGTTAFEHRVLYYDNHIGDLECHWCSVPLTWKSMQVDHLNDIPNDNSLSNLVASCGACNRARGHHKMIATMIARRSRMVTFNGETLTLARWSQRLGITRQALRDRLRQWPLEYAMTRPRGRSGPQK